jgi:hypothetical protein
VDVYRELLIVHPSVVDPFLDGGRSYNGAPEAEGGPWSLRSLLRFLVVQLVEADRQSFYASLFEQWTAAQTADNGIQVPARDLTLVKTLLLDQFSTADATGKRTYDMSKLPFELIAIAYRPDLRASDGSDAGELHFVYKLIAPNGQDARFTINVEYKIQTTFYDAAQWAHNFHRLGELEVGSEEYLQLLQKLTWYTTNSIFNYLPKLGQIRTNEVAFDPANAAWELREFVANAQNFGRKRMLASSVENTPLASFNNTQTLADFIAQNPVLSQPGTGFMSFKLPETLSLASGTTTFLDAHARPGTQWVVPGQSFAARSPAVDNLGTLTCNGCHQDNKAAGDIEFHHVQPDVSPLQDGTARLSKFLTTPDAMRPQSRPGELNRRKADLTQLLAQPWTPKWITP